MGQVPRGPQLGERDRPSHRFTRFALVGAATLAIGVFWVLQQTETPATSKQSSQVRGTLVVIGRTAAGQPVRGLTGELRDPTASAGLAGQPGDGGELRFDHAASGSGILDLRAPGFERLRRQVLLSAGKRTLTIELAPGAQVTVRVVDDRGAPIPAAEIEAWDPSAAPNRVEFDTWEGATDTAGEALLDGLPRRSLSISAYAPGHETVTLTDIDPTRGDPAPLVLQRTANIDGQLLRRQGRSPAAGTVIIAGSGVWPPRRLDVGASGHFVIEGLPGGVYELHASAPGWVADPVEGITVDPGESAEATLLLAPAVRMRARVIDAQSGQPVAGAQVQVGESSLAFSAATTATNAAGEVTVDGLRPRTYRLSIQAEGYVPLTAVEQVPGDNVVTHAVVAAAEIRGLVVDSDGRPVVGASLEITGDAADGIPLAMTQGSLAFRAKLLSVSAAGPVPLMRSDNLGVTVGAVPRIPIATLFAAHRNDDAPTDAAAQVSLLGFTSDAVGQFTLTGIPPGTVQLLVAQPGWALARSALLAVKAGARISGIRIVLQRGAQVSGTVADSRGFPLAAVRVELECERDPTPRSTLTDEAGRYALPGALGQCSVTASPRDLPPSRATLVAANDAMLEIDLTVAAEATRFQCSVVDTGGFPVVGAAVRVEGQNASQPTSGASLSHADGSVEISGLGAPPYNVEISHPEFATLSIASVDQAEGRRFVLLAGAVVRGTVLAAADRSPLSGARVELRSAVDSAPRVSRSGSLGVFEIRNVTAGDYLLNLLHPQTLPSTRTVVVRERDVTQGEVELGEVVLAASGSASGTVTDRLGVPVPGARVSSGTATSTTDSTGSFVLSGLAPGLVDVAAVHRSAGRAIGAARTRVFAGQDSPGVRLQLDGRFEPSDDRLEAPAAEDVTQADIGSVARLGVAIEVATLRGAVAVTNVVAGSLAERAGLRPGDVIRGIDGEPVVIAGQARSLLRGEIDSMAAIDITRGNQRHRIQTRRERFVLPGSP